MRPPTSAPCSTRIYRDRKSTRLNSSHSQISYAVFCLKKKKITELDDVEEGLLLPGIDDSVPIIYPIVRNSRRPYAAACSNQGCENSGGEAARHANWE